MHIYIYIENSSLDFSSTFARFVINNEIEFSIMDIYRIRINATSWQRERESDDHLLMAPK